MALRFRLARVLRLRTQLREQAEDELARVRAELAALRAQVEEMRTARLATRAAEEDAATGAVLTGAELAAYRGYEATIDAREAALERKSAETTVAIGAAREALLARRQEERQLERLEERSQAAAATDEAHRIDTLLDELALRGRGERR